jgi:hypothetical protein
MDEIDYFRTASIDRAHITKAASRTGSTNGRCGRLAGIE